jgi:hypothetical protein
MYGVDLALALRRSTTFATAAALADTDAFKASFASPTSATTYSVATLDGALANPGPVTDLKMKVARYPSVTTNASPATFNTTDPIIWTGTRGGVEVTVQTLLTQAGGNETIIGTTPLDTLTSVYVPAQLGGGGLMELGFSGIACPRRHLVDQRFPFMAVDTGTVKVGWPDGVTDNFPVQAYLVAPISPYRIYADTTDVGVAILD